MSSKAQFLELFLSHQTDIKAFVRSLVRSRQDSEDVFQEVTLTLWEKFDQYQPERSFGAWARGIARNKILQYWDKASRVPTPFSPEAVEAILDAFDRRTEQTSPSLDALEKCLETLSEKSRQLLALRYGRSWSVRRASDVFTQPAVISLDIATPGRLAHR